MHSSIKRLLCVIGIGALLTTPTPVAIPTLTISGVAITACWLRGRSRQGYEEIV